MKTKFGDLEASSLVSRIEEFRKVGEDEFLRRYTNGRGAKTTWISYEGELFPSKAIFRAAFLPIKLPPSFQTSDTYVFAREMGLEIVRFEDGLLETRRSAIDDLDELSGIELPVRQQYFGERYIRNAKVRCAVLCRANGRCEHCGVEGFKTLSGGRYLETHHIISLSKQGPDREDNVIALCSNDHRRAHFGTDWEQLEDEFKAKLADFRGR